MSTALLAIDVGGSTSRALLVDRAGTCLGRGRNLGGNPASNTPADAAGAIISAVAAARAEADGPLAIEVALIALAGPRAHVDTARLETAFRDMGLTGPLLFAGDLQAMLASVTAAESGYCIVAGTGAGAVRIRAGAIDRVADAVGWLLGDLGSGYWLGPQAAIAVAADLDGRGPATALTPVVLGALGLELSEARAHDSRPLALRALIDAVYAGRPIALARFAPLVVAARGDGVADRLLAEAEAYLLADFERVFDPQMPGPVALGGGIIAHLGGLGAAVSGVLAAAGHVPDIRRAGDGSVGAVVLAMRALGQPVDEALVKHIAASVAARG
jgi:N-acetylglucosamine kinase-like BadF-type ATPase